MRKGTLLPILMVLGAALLLLSLLAPGAPAASGHERTYAVKAEETIQKTFTLPVGHKTLDVDNVFGSIEVVGGGSNEVQITVTKTIRAESDADVERAKKEVTLDMQQKDGDVKLYVDGPFRCQCHCDDCRGSHDDRNYIVQMDFKIQVPAEIDVRARTVNSGSVTVKNVTGDFSVHNVNGRIEMSAIAGSGSATTVNGPVRVSFRQNPGKSSGFKTINGDVELKFAQGLSADFRLKTFNGGIYTDFPVTALPAQPVSEERRGGKLILRADRSAGARIGAGGPEIQIENLNGDIRILENHE